MTLSLAFVRALALVGPLALHSGIVYAQSLPMETSLPPATYAAYSLAEDASTFDPDSEENRQLLAKGFGFPVRVVETRQHHALVTSQATSLLVPAPLGWRGFDDGRRTRLFAPGGTVGLVYSVVSLDGVGTWDQFRDRVWAEVQQQSAARAQGADPYRATLINLPDDVFGVREANVPGRQGAFSSIILFRKHPADPKQAVRLGLYAPAEVFGRYLGLAGLAVGDITLPKR